MLPTPDTPNLPGTVYPPSEDSYLLLDVLSSASETSFLSSRFNNSNSNNNNKNGNPPSSTPTVVEIGTGSGVVLAFATAHSRTIFGRADVVALAVDLNRDACRAAGATVALACQTERACSSSSSASRGVTGMSETTSTIDSPGETEVGPVAAATATAAVAGKKKKAGGTAAVVDSETRLSSEAAGFPAGSAGGLAAAPAPAPAPALQAVTAAQAATHGSYLAAVQADLTSALRAGSVDVLIFNPPYVPTDEVPLRPPDSEHDDNSDDISKNSNINDENGGDKKEQHNNGGNMAHAKMAKTDGDAFERESRLLDIAVAGGVDGMEVTDRLLAELGRVLSARGVAYVLFSVRNAPDRVAARLRALGWLVDTVGGTGRKGGIEKLVVLRIARRGWRS